MCCKTEKWRDIPGFPGYRVSNRGRVMSLKRDKPRLMKPWGGNAVNLSTPDGQVTIRIAQLVADIFIGPAPAGYLVSHIDGDDLNNHACNLKYVCRERRSKELNAIETRQRQLLRRHIALRRMTKIRELRAQNLSLGEIGECIGFSASMVCRVLRGERWKRTTHGGSNKRSRK